MTLSLAQALTDVRLDTRHDLDSARMPDTFITRKLNEEYVRLRTWLREVSPTLYLITSADIIFSGSGQIEDVPTLTNFEALHRVDRLIGSQWIPVESAGLVNPQQHGSRVLSFRTEGALLYVGPELFSAGTYRIMYHATPDYLTTGNFAIPVELEIPLKMRACGWTCPRNADGLKAKKEWFDAAKEILDEVEPELRRRHGIIQPSFGVRRVNGY